MKKIGLLIIGLCLLGLLVFSYFFFFSKTEENNVIDQKNGYVLLANASEYEKELFARLEEDLDDEEKASLIYQLFLANFYSLDLANSKNDVRGVQFVYEPFQKDFIDLAKEHVYTMVQNNFFSKRTQQLQMVEEVIVIEALESTFEKGDTSFESYIVRGEVVYEKNPGFREEVELEIIINNEKFEVVKMTAYLSNV